MKTRKLCLNLPEKLATRLRAMDDPDAFAALVLNRAMARRNTPDFRQATFEVRKPGHAGSTADDDLFDEAVELVLREGQGSTSLIQRAFSVGYSRAARLIDAMHREGILGPQRGSHPRRILITLAEWKARHHKPRTP